ncbi:MAG: hypothetical protein CSB24_06635 [Deltaproteobacteria bacterium]|nr:MAG: hypothetical protein CSB24_06635 [Deltaproteobacteria bacterium]
MKVKAGEDHVLLRAGALRLLVPQSQISQIRHFNRIDLQGTEVIVTQEQLARNIEEKKEGLVFLSENLGILTRADLQRFVYTSWQIAPAVQWCWTEVLFVGQEFEEVSDIPGVLQIKRSPFSAIVTLKNQRYAFLCDVRRLIDYVISTRGVLL